jgi:hypothetical protein
VIYACAIEFLKIWERCIKETVMSGQRFFH